MAPKAGKGGSAPSAGKAKAGAGGPAGKSGGGDLDGPQEEPLLGVILADSYHSARTSRFAPLDAATPTCLLHLAGAPILHWTIEALARADVARIYVLSTQHTAQLRAHIDAHFHKHVYGYPSITVLPIPQAGSTGDALRELDARQIVRASDFILVHADYVGNLDLAELVRVHKERRRRDRDAIMTVATMAAPAGGWAGASVAGDEGAALWAIDQAKGGQLRHYYHRPIVAAPGSSSSNSTRAVSGESASVPWELFTGVEDTVGALDVHTDLVDCGVDVCSMDVPPLFSENFDYQHLRRDFIPGILISDLLTAKIFVHLAPSMPSNVPRLDGLIAPPSPFGGQACSGYGARVSSSKAYHAISMDVLGRWLLPLGPSGVLPGPAAAAAALSTPGYAIRAGHCYVHASAHLIPEPPSESSQNNEDATAKAQQVPAPTLGQYVMLGPRTQVHSSAHVAHSVLGADVRVKSRSVVRGSLVHDAVNVGRDCRVEHCVLGTGVTLLDGTRLGKGCLIEAGVVLGPNVEIRAGSRVGLRSAAEFDDEDDDTDTADRDAVSKAQSGKEASAELGAQANGQLWPFLGERSTQDGDDDDDDDKDAEDSAADNWRNVLLLRIGSTAAEAERIAVELEQDEGLFDDSEGDGYASLSEEELDAADDDDEEDEDDDEDDDEDVDEDGVPSARPSAMHSRSNTNAISFSGGGGANTDAGHSAGDAASARRLLDFRSEARASLTRALAENHTLENASIELKTLRMASNVTLLELRATVLSFLMGTGVRVMQGGSGATGYGKLWTRWGGLVKAVASEVADQVQVVSALQTYCATRPEATKLFVPTLKLFYNEDIVEDEAIIDWWRSPASRAAAPSGISAPGYGVSGPAADDEDEEEDEEADEIVEAGEEAMKALRASAEPVLRFILESQDDEEDEDSD